MPVFTEIKRGFFSSDFFREFCHDEKCFDVASVYIGESSTGIYDRWKHTDNGKKYSVDQLAEVTAKILTNGLSGL